MKFLLLTTFIGKKHLHCIHPVIQLSYGKIFIIMGNIDYDTPINWRSHQKLPY